MRLICDLDYAKNYNNECIIIVYDHNSAGYIMNIMCHINHIVNLLILAVL